MKTTNFKKSLCMLLVLALSFSLFGCKKDEVIDPTENTSVVETTEVTEITEAATENTETGTSPTEEIIDETEPKETKDSTVSTSPAHVHQWTDKVTKPTCTSVGYTTHTCECGKKEVDSYIAANGHSWNSWKTITEATETSTGKAERTCSVCAKTESRILPKVSAAHKHSYTSTVTTAPTCSNFGVNTFVCDCGDKYTEDIAKIDHKYTSEVFEATCILRGYTLYTCSACNNSYKDNYTSIGKHNYNENVTKPTCTNQGYTTYKCKVCYDTYVDNYVPANGHSWGNWNVTKEATTTSTGIKERICKNCSKKETEVIDKIFHSHEYTSKITTKATCESTGVKTFTCNCGYSYTESISSTGHAWGSWKVTKEASENNTGTKERSCATCKKVETATIPKVEHSHSLTHIVTKPTCTTGGYTTHKCSTCSHSYIDSKVPATGHSWSEWNTVVSPTSSSTGKAERSCSVCRVVDSKTLDKLPDVHTHNYNSVIESVDATCDKDGYVKKSCSCGEVKTDTIPAGHNWEHHHEDEVGHMDGKIVCHCGGWSASPDEDYISSFAAHVNSVDPETRYDHSYTESYYWVVDSPAKDWDECTKCHSVK